MSETCPGCGAGVRPWCDESPATEDRLFWCGRLERVIKGRMWDVIESETCLRRQLAQRDERNAALEARNKELEAESKQHDRDWAKLMQAVAEADPSHEHYYAGPPDADDPEFREQYDPWEALRRIKSDLAALRPVVRAAMEMETAASAVIRADKQPDNALVARYAHTSAEVTRLVRALTPEIRKRITEEVSHE